MAMMSPCESYLPVLLSYRAGEMHRTKKRFTTALRVLGLAFLSFPNDGSKRSISVVAFDPGWVSLHAKNPSTSFAQWHFKTIDGVEEKRKQKQDPPSRNRAVKLNLRVELEDEQHVPFSSFLSLLKMNGECGCFWEGNAF
ncbi:Uncharacterized protein APZ42_032623 [Daphnia magna]|uniref:Uncharacterized protein n=1 Tax=Daphnia magna TaxID=35525 RepID=A0A0P5WRG0_9CRUS|nr:Uncharacterized protein APZ42_032623 [Daphnia magna]